MIVQSIHSMQVVLTSPMLYVAVEGNGVMISYDLVLHHKKVIIRLLIQLQSYTISSLISRHLTFVIDVDLNMHTL